MKDFLELETMISAMAGTFTDPRDGRTYKTVKIGRQTWKSDFLRMAQIRIQRFNGEVK